MATRVFICASIAFGVLGMAFVVTVPNAHESISDLHIGITKLLMATVFIILPSFALSIAGKYLGSKS